MIRMSYPDLRRLVDSLDPIRLAQLRMLVNRKPTTLPVPAEAPATYRGVPVPEVLRPNWDQHEAAWWTHGVRATLDTVVPLLTALADDEPCTFDHHGYCQMHGLPQPGPCPDGEAQRLLKEARPEG